MMTPNFKNLSRFLYRLLFISTLWLWRLLVIMLILLAVIISIGREMAPLLKENKLWLESRLTALSGYVVEMASVEAKWEGLSPELSARGLSVGNFAKIDKAHLRVDLLRSAIHRTLVFDALAMEGAAIQATVDPQNPQSDFDLQRGLEFLFGSAHIRLRYVTVSIFPEKGEALLLRIPSLDVINQADDHWLQGNLNIANATESVELVGYFTGDASAILAGNGKAYLDFGENSRLQDAMNFAVRYTDLPLYARHAKRLQSRIWLEWEKNHLQWRATTNIQQLKFSSQAYEISYQGELAGDFYLRDSLLDTLSNEPRYELTSSIRSSDVQINQRNYQLPPLGFRYQFQEKDSKNPDMASWYIPVLDLASVKQYTSLISDLSLRRALETLNFRGQLNDVILDWPLSQSPDVRPRLRANLTDVSASAWQDAPALQHVNGYLESNTERGFVEVSSPGGFSMYFPGLYARPMIYEKIRGRVGWYIDPVSHYIYVGSEKLELKGEEGDGAAAFWLELPPAMIDRASHMVLAVGLKETPVKYRDKYLPNTLPPALRQWLKSSVRDGALAESAFIYRGSLRANESQERSIQFFGRMQNIDLKFDPAWPLLSGLNGTFLVDNEDVQADITRAKLHGLALKHTTAAVKSGNFLTLQGDIQGPGNAALDLLRNTTLRKVTGSAFDAWQMQGDLSARMSLGISLSHDVAGDYQDVAISLKNNSLLLRDIKLPFEKLNGDMYYSSVLGLSALQIKGELWGRQHVVNIAPVVDEDGLPDILLTSTGNVDPERLADWSQLPLVRFFKGEIPLQGKIEVPLDTSPGQKDTPHTRLAFFSNLEGVTIDLPAPFRKSHDASQPMAVNVELLEDFQRYRVVYSDIASAQIEVPTAAAVRGKAWVNLPAAMQDKLGEGLHIEANLAEARLSEWLKVVERYSQWSEKAAAVKKAGEEKSPTAWPSFDVSLDNFYINDLDVGNTRLQISHEQAKDKAAWRAHFEHFAATGDYWQHDDDKLLPRLDLSRLDLDRWNESRGVSSANEDSEQESALDPLADAIPQELPALEFHAQQVLLDGGDLGDWKYTVQPKPWGAALENLVVTAPGMLITGIKENEGAHVEWRLEDKKMSTRVASKIILTGGEGVKNLFGVDRIVQAKESSLHGVIEWSGSPVHMQYRNLLGEVTFHSSDGRFLNSNARTDLMRVINVFNFNTWARRLRLDFSDLYKSGISYDRLHGHVKLDRGLMTVDEPLVMESPSSRFAIKGKIDSINNSIDADLSVTLPVSDNATWITALAGGLPAAVGVWAVSKIFKSQIDNLSSVTYTLSGSLDDPEIKFKHMLNNTKEKKPPAAEAVKSPPDTTTP